MIFLRRSPRSMFPCPARVRSPPVKASLIGARGFPMRRRPAMEETLARHTPLSRRARGGWAPTRDLAAALRCPDVAAHRVSPTMGRARRCDASVSLGEACHGRGRRRPTSAATTIVGTNRRKRDPRNDPSPRVRAAEPPPQRVRSRNAGAHGRTSGSRAAHGAFAPRTPGNASRFVSDDATPCDGANGSEDETGRGPRVEESLPGRMGSSPARDRRALGVAGRCANDGLEPAVANPPTRPEARLPTFTPRRASATSANPSAFRRRHRAWAVRDRSRRGSVTIRRDPRGGSLHHAEATAGPQLRRPRKIAAELRDEAPFGPFAVRHPPWRMA